MKLLNVLTSQSLFFTRCDKLGDPHEGAVSRENITLEQAELGPAVAAALSKARAEWGKHIAVNCWHLSRDESSAMWRLYGLSEGGVAIRTMIGQLMDSFQNDEPVYIGAIRYRDYSEPVTTTNTFAPFLYKREIFSHEREIRAVIGRTPTVGPAGMDLSAETFVGNGERVGVDVPTLVDAVVCSPGSPDWVVGTVREVLSRFDTKIEVHKSPIDDPAIF